MSERNKAGATQVASEIGLGRLTKSTPCASCHGPVEWAWRGWSVEWAVPGLVGQRQGARSPIVESVYLGAATARPVQDVPGLTRAWESCGEWDWWSALGRDRGMHGQRLEKRRGDIWWIAT
jgi:hypothetical protein